jgi:NTP pyrophosphatase (non-canonical NTP hydrolase)
VSNREENADWENDPDNSEEYNLNALSRECYKIAKEKGWHDQERSVGESIALMHSELSEALEDYRDGYGPNVQYVEVVKDDEDNSIFKPCGIPSELADTIIRILDFCGEYMIDIDKAVRDKMEFNRTRSHRHGGKKL